VILAGDALKIVLWPHKSINPQNGNWICNFQQQIFDRMKSDKQQLNILELKLAIQECTAHPPFLCPFISQLKKLIGVFSSPT